MIKSFLKKEKKTTVEGVTRLKNGMAHLIERIESDKLIELDNTNITTNETSIFISNNIIDGMAKKYILK